MKERGMIFNGEMVRAILDGRKTQTRRAVSDRHLHMIDVASQAGECYPLDSGTDHSNSQSYYREWCPFGAVGDRIWVRETWNKYGGLLTYRADHDWIDEMRKEKICNVKWTPSIHMPRWASRITLEITDVRVERLNAISEEDAMREGIDADRLAESQDNYDCIADHNMTGRPTATGAFKYLWESIYGEESWNANHWVWVISFKRVEGGAA